MNISNLFTGLNEAQVPTGGKFLTWGTTVPTDAATGYAPRCLFVHTDGSGIGDAVYVNIGTVASCDFDPIGGGAGIMRVTAAAGTTIVAGDFVYVSGYDVTNGLLEVTEAQANAVATARDLYWAPTAITAETQGYVTKLGAITATVTGAAVNTNAGNVGDPVYLSDGTAGLWTLTEPTGTDYVVQVGVIAVKSSTIGVISVDLGGEHIPVHDHADDAGGGLLVTPALAGTTNATFTVGDAAGTTPRIALGENTSKTGDFVATIKPGTLGANRSILLPDSPADADEIVLKGHTQELSAKTLITPTISATGWANANHAHDAANTGGVITITGSTGTTNSTFTVGDAAGTTPRIALSEDTGGTGDYVVSLKPAATTWTSNRTVLVPDGGGDDTVLLAALAQGVTGKTFTSCAYASGTLSGTFTGTVVMGGTWTNLGTVLDCDINGGDMDGVTIGAATPAAVTGTSITGTTLTDGTFSVASGAVTGIRGVTSGTGEYNFDYSPSTGTFKTSTGTNTFGGNVVIAGTKTFTTGTGLSQVLGDLEVAGDIDTTAAAGLAVGSTVATSLALGRAGITTTINGVADLSAAVDTALANGDSILFLDDTDSSLTKKEALADVVALLAGTNATSALSAANSVLKVNVGGTTALGAAITPGTDKLLLEDGGVNTSVTYQVFMDNASALAADAIASGSTFMILNANVAKTETIDDIAAFMAGRGLTATAGVIDATNQRWTFGVPGASAVGTDFGATGCLAGCDQVLDVTQTEAAAAFCKSYNHDNTKYANISVTAAQGEWTANYQLFPDVEVENDACYFGAAVPFGQIYFDMSATVAVYGADSIIWEYYNGTTWATLTIAYDHTDADDQDGDRPFQRDGSLAFVPPANWAATTVDSQEAYWIRARCTATVNITTIPLTDSVEHKVSSPADGFKAPCAGNISALRLVDNVGTAHTTADIKFFLMNFTKGTYSLELTFPQDKRQDIFTGTDLKAASAGVDVDAGDVLGLIMTQKDGTNELTNALVELAVTPA